MKLDKERFELRLNAERAANGTCVSSVGECDEVSQLLRDHLGCPDDQKVAAYIDGDLGFWPWWAVMLHERRCPICRRNIRQLRRVIPRWATVISLLRALWPVRIASVSAEASSAMAAPKVRPSRIIISLRSLRAVGAVFLLCAVGFGGGWSFGTRQGYRAGLVRGRDEAPDLTFGPEKGAPGTITDPTLGRLSAERMLQWLLVPDTRNVREIDKRVRFLEGFLKAPEHQRMGLHAVLLELYRQRMALTHAQNTKEILVGKIAHEELAIGPLLEDHQGEPIHEKATP